ncbi:hypothetical protein LTR15_008438 [Elasticomyces elasticus]|nr:hypothetical protein LTR15_008438 [Elasticomyces elasticus]
MEPSMLEIDGPPSSPFVTEVEPSSRSPSKQWPAAQPQAANDYSILFDDDDMEGHNENSAPAPIQSFHEEHEDKENMPLDEPTATLKRVFASPQKSHCTPEKRVPLKPSTPETEPLPDSSDSDLMPPPPPSMRKTTTPKQRTPLKASRTQQQTKSSFQAGLDLRNSSPQQAPQAHDMTSIDDTCFSTFSEMAVPDMTLFAQLRQSPTKTTASTPRSTRKRPSPSRSPSPTPRRQQRTPAGNSGDGTTSFLIDFTQQMSDANMPRQHHTSPGKAATESNLLQYINNQRSPNKARTYATPTKPKNSILNLLDFELPPPPTPRSVPTITVRELESLKSSYLSQISSLKATLSGREAEVESLKKAVQDAERRVGESLEQVREERGRREHVEVEKGEWEKRGREVEQVLVSVKEEVMRSETEKEEMRQRISDTEARVEDAETRAIKAEERFADALAARGSGSSIDDAEGERNGVEERVQRLVSAQIDAKIDAVSRELHAVYKEKHERKVGTLKKSYEAKAERKVSELQARLAEVEQRNETLEAARDSTFSGPVSNGGGSGNAELKAELEQQAAVVARLEQEMSASRSQLLSLEQDLKQERIEKGDLVAAVDEMLMLQSEGAAPATAVAAMSVVEDFRKSIRAERPSGLRAPGSVSGVGSRIGGVGRTGAAGGKSRLLSNIERMGRRGESAGAGAAAE